MEFGYDREKLKGHVNRSMHCSIFGNYVMSVVPRFILIDGENDFKAKP